MSKHVSAERKLHVSQPVKDTKQLPKSRLAHQPNGPSGAPTGTNAKNQFR